MRTLSVLLPAVLSLAAAGALLLSVVQGGRLWRFGLLHYWNRINTRSDRD